jgi:hypothetical protein
VQQLWTGMTAARPKSSGLTVPSAQTQNACGAAVTSVKAAVSHVMPLPRIVDPRIMAIP